MDASRTQVAVTAIGVVSCLGQGEEVFAERLFGGECGLAKHSFMYAGHLIEGSAGYLPLAASHPFFGQHDLPYDKCSHLAIIAAEECAAKGRIEVSGCDPSRVGVVVGTSLGGMLSGDIFHTAWLEDGIARADPNLLRQYPIHAIADVVAMRFGYRGARTVVSTACAAGGSAIAFGYDLIRDGVCDMAIVGGVDPLSRFSFAGFRALKALDPEPCAPYSGSHGINLGEGAAFLLLESVAHARARLQPVLAELLSYGASEDAYHRTAPDPGGNGAVRAMRAALAWMGASPTDVSYVNGHGTGTPANDAAEQKAFRTAFRDCPDVPMSSIKGAIGHCLGAAGAIEAVACVLAVQDDRVPPTLKAGPLTPGGLNLVPERAQERACDIVLSNSFAFGGNNLCLVLGKPDGAHRALPPDDEDPIVVTGIGCLGVGGQDARELWDTLAASRSCLVEAETLLEDDDVPYWVGAMPDVDWKRFIASKHLRTTDTVTRLTMGAGREALSDSGLRITHDTMDRVGVIYATGTGPLETVEKLNRGLVVEGADSVSSLDFPNSVLNAAPGNFCIDNSLKGPSTTLSAGGASFLVGLVRAVGLLRNRLAEAFVVVGADECNIPLLTGYRKMGLLSSTGGRPCSAAANGMIPSQGAVAIVLERRSDALARGARVYATVTGYGLASDNVALGHVDGQGIALAESVGRALNSAHLDDVDIYMSCAGGVPEFDEAESRMVERVFGPATRSLNVQALLGSSAGTVGGYGILGALFAFEQGCRTLPHVHGPAGDDSGRPTTACIGAMSFGGICAAVTLAKG